MAGCHTRKKRNLSTVATISCSDSYAMLDRIYLLCTHFHKINNVFSQSFYWNIIYSGFKAWKKSTYKLKPLLLFSESCFIFSFVTLEKLFLYVRNYWHPSRNKVIRNFFSRESFLLWNTSIHINNTSCHYFFVGRGDFSLNFIIYYRINISWPDGFLFYLRPCKSGFSSLKSPHFILA